MFNVHIYTIYAVIYVFTNEGTNNTCTSAYIENTLRESIHQTATHQPPPHYLSPRGRRTYMAHITKYNVNELPRI